MTSEKIYFGLSNVRKVMVVVMVNVVMSDYKQCQDLADMSVFK